MAVELDPLAGPDGGDEGRRLAKYWLDQIDVVHDAAEIKRHLKRGDQIIKRYRDERERTSNEDGQRRYGSLWSNVQILQPALYGKEPLPIAERRFRDKDPVGRNAASILERALRNEIEINGYHDALKRVVLDYLLVGQGVPWVRYEPQIAEGVSLPVETETDMKDSQGRIISSGNDVDGSHTDPVGEDSIPATRTGKGRERAQLNTDDVQPTDQPDDQQSEEAEKLEYTDDRVVRESTPVDYVPWRDFITFPLRARTWKEVTAIGKRCYLSRQQLIRRFGKKIGKAIPLRKDKRGDKTQHNTDMMPGDQDKGEVYEIWNKEDLTVYWVSEGYSFLCDRKDDPLNLENYFPTPEPIFANPTNTTLIPVPDYIQYEDQAVQIDELTQRIAMLTKAAKITGVYNAAAKDIQRMFQESVENELIPVDDWAAFAEEGGVAGNISFMPIKDIIGLINELVQVREKLIEDMDRLTGINDIMRGTSDARETMGGVRIKSNNTGTRLTERQNDVARLARDVIRIMADIMCQHFSPQSLIEASGALYEEGLGPDDMPQLGDLAAMGGMPLAPQASTVPPQPAGMPAMPQGRPPMAAPAPPLAGQSSNVVPFTGQMRPNMPPSAPVLAQPPIGGPSQPPMGLPGAPPQAQVPQQPPIPPELLAKIQAVQRIAKAIQLLRDERLRGFRVDIEVDSTIYPDQAQDKQDRTEFIGAVTKFLGETAQLGAAVPQVIPLLGKLLQFGARAYRVGRDLEVSIESFCDEMAVVAKQKAQNAVQQPNPEQIKANAQAQKAQTDLTVGTMRAKADIARAQSDLQDTQAQDQANQREQNAEIQRTLIEGRQQQQQSAAEIQLKQMEVRMREMEMAMEKMRMLLEVKQMHEQAMQPPVIDAPSTPSHGNAA